MEKINLWHLSQEKKEFVLPPNVSVFGCRLKILAPEYILGQEVASILQDSKSLDFSFLNIENFDFSDFKLIVKQWEQEFLKIKLDNLKDFIILSGRFPPCKIGM